MIIVRIMGGLGNQLFQYAFAYSLSLQFNQVLKIDTSFYIKNKERKFGLENYNLSYEEATKEECKKLKEHKFVKICSQLFSRTKYSKMHYYEKLNVDNVVEFNLQFIANLIKSKKNIYLDGYFQSQQYFINNRKNILSMFKVKTGLTLKCKKYKEMIINDERSCSIHIRRGDYLNKKNRDIYQTCSQKYYSKAIEIMESKYSNINYYIFSDDNEWVKSNFKVNNVIYIDNNSPNEDLLLMSLCKHNIIANSSFSWWGAWLNENENSHVIAPKKWYKEASMKNVEHGLIPDKWLTI